MHSELLLNPLHRKDLSFEARRAWLGLRTSSNRPFPSYKLVPARMVKPCSRFNKQMRRVLYKQSVVHCKLDCQANQHARCDEFEGCH